MREIKFRGKRVDGNHNWVCGSLITNGDKCFIIVDGNLQIGYNNTLGNSSIQEVIPETVGEYTGLKDKHGREIYEGNVLRCKCQVVDYNDVQNPLQRYKYRNSVIEWWQSSCNMGYRLRDEAGKTIMLKPSMLNAMEAEIIGTIHDQKAEV